VSFFRTAGGLLALWGEANLAADARLPPRTDSGFRGVALAMNLDSPDQVDAALAAAVAAGATLLKEGQRTEWGGYQGIFADLDGHVWEVAHNPDWPIGADERPTLP
jgi:uncharacterized protein